ncbi:zinc-finger homeodomain protein 4-like [Henckelia pumila]|uniref:zinc-finger homeodomain protein 4-like n=1 Tax=Henckelia pumila TaxID=405737 RepID=UPI003C6E4A5C
MELPNQEDHEMPIPLNSSYGHGHMMHHHPNMIQQIPASNAGPLMMGDDHEAAAAFKKMVRYKECLKNHAASMGGNATDGCGEFMPSGEEGTLEALVCSACSCHRNFHRKETEGDIQHNNYYLNSRLMGRKLLNHHATLGTLISSRNVAPHHPMIMPVSESDEQEPVHQMVIKKRFRTKFTQDQKDKMHGFAEKVGWKIQKQEESLVQHFCQEIGVKRRVLKVWMHNNKHNLAKKNHQSNPHDHNQVLETNN